MEAPSKLVLLHGIASKSKNMLHNTTLYYTFKKWNVFKVHHSYLHKQPQKVKRCCGKSPRVRVQPIANKCGFYTGTATKVSFLHAHDNDIPISRLLARLQKCQPCLYNVFITRNPKVQNSAFESLVGFNWRVFTSLKTKKNKAAFTIGDCQ